MSESVLDAIRRVDAVGGAGRPFGEERPVSIQEPAPRSAPVDTAALARGLRHDAAFADAHWIVGRAIARSERDASHPRPDDSAAMQEIIAILLRVQENGG